MKVLIFEAKGATVVAEEAVRIFVNFQRVESAVKGACAARCLRARELVLMEKLCLWSAKIDLDGRFFGGRTVTATFFSEDKFNATRLEDS